MAFPIGAALSAGASLLGGFLNKNDSAAQRKWASQENALNRQFQHDEAELAYNRNEATRLDQNQWNSEPEQVKRLKQAGINPYNVLSGLSGSSVTSAGNTASAGNAHGSSLSYQRADNLSWIQGIAQAGLVAAQTRNLDANTKKIESDTKGQDLNNDYQAMYNEIFKDYGRVEALTRLNKLDAERSWTDAQSEFTRIQSKIGQFDLDRTKPQQYANMVAEEAATYARKRLDEINAMKSDTERQIALRKLDFELALIGSMTAANSATAYNQRMQGNYAVSAAGAQNELGALYKSEAGNNRLNSHLIKARVDFGTSIYNDYKHEMNSIIGNKLHLDLKDFNSLNDHYWLSRVLNAVGNAAPMGVSAPFPNPNTGLMGLPY